MTSFKTLINCSFLLYEFILLIKTVHWSQI